MEKSKRSFLILCIRLNWDFGLENEIGSCFEMRKNIMMDGEVLFGLEGEKKEVKVIYLFYVIGVKNKMID